MWISYSSTRTPHGRKVQQSRGTVSVMFDWVQSVSESLEKAYARPLQVFAILLWMSIMPLAAFWQLLSYFFPPYWLWMQYDTTPQKQGFRVASMQNLVVWKWFKFVCCFAKQ